MTGAGSTATATTTATAWLFPGQGAQRVGMGRDLYAEFPAARALFDRADAALDRPLTQIIFDGPEDLLVQTVNAQPAIVVTSLAALAAAEEEHGPLPAPAFMAGHSLGEYTALIATGALPFEAGLRLVQKRGRFMQEANAGQPGTMAVIMGLAEDVVQAVCDETGAELCNINSDQQIVVGGSREAVARAMDLAKARGARRALALRVSGAFHSSLMNPAEARMRLELARVPFSAPRVPIVANVSAHPLRDVPHLRDELATQVCRVVRWRQMVEYMLGQGVETFLEFGPGSVLTSLVKTIAHDAAAAHDSAPTLQNINDAASARLHGAAAAAGSAVRA